VTYHVNFELAASRDVEMAFESYELRHTGLGADFLRTVAMAADLLARDPERFAITRVSFRWIKLRRFPFALHYRIKGDTVLIVACLHFRQSPTRWPQA